jgi:hypothetical protein
VLILTLAVAAPPLSHVGRIGNDGNRYYRAYFTADFVWHTALTSELGKFSMPPRNPYLARQPIHYYWTYYLLPAAVASRPGPCPRRPAVSEDQRADDGSAAHLGESSLPLDRHCPCDWHRNRNRAGARASSAEGLFETYSLWSRGVPLAELRNWNIDAVTAWPPSAGIRSTVYSGAS